MNDIQHLHQVEKFEFKKQSAKFHRFLLTLTSVLGYHGNINLRPELK